MKCFTRGSLSAGASEVKLLSRRDSWILSPPPHLFFSSSSVLGTKLGTLCVLGKSHAIPRRCMTHAVLMMVIILILNTIMSGSLFFYLQIQMTASRGQERRDSSVLCVTAGAKDAG